MQESCGRLPDEVIKTVQPPVLALAESEGIKTKVLLAYYHAVSRTRSSPPVASNDFGSRDTNTGMLKKEP